MVHTTLITIALRQIKHFKSYIIPFFEVKGLSEATDEILMWSYSLRLQPNGVSRNENILFGRVF